MSYVVLARKWRPQSFEDLVGQEHVSTTIANAILRDRVAHAFLFTGVRGVGKTTSARILAKALNCVKGPTPTPCQTCAACTEITSGSAVDVQEIDGASYTGVDDVRKLQETLPYRPQRDRFKILIVDEVHMLSVNAWNAFLKTLEEPPPHVKFIFATTEVHKVPVTILSRCQRYDFKLISAQTIAARLKFVLGEEKIVAEDGAIGTIAREAAGSMRDAMSLLDQVIAWVGTTGDKITAEGTAKVLGVADRSVLHRLAAALIDADASACVKIVGELSQEGYDIPHVAKNILIQLRDLAVAKVCDTPGSLLDLAQEEIADVKALASRADADDLVRLHQGFSKAFDDIVRGGQPRASLEMTLIRLARRPPMLPVDELLRRLGDLEKRLGGGSPAGPGGGPSRGGAPPAGRGGGSWSGGPARPQFDGPRADAPRADAPRADAYTPPPARTEAPKADAYTPPPAPKAEPPRAEAPKAEPPRAETPKAEPPKADAYTPPPAPKAEPPRAEAPQAEAPKADAYTPPAVAKAEAPKVDAYTPPPAPKAAASPAWRPRADDPNGDADTLTSAGVEPPKFEAPRANVYTPAEAPKFEAPKFEPPRTNAYTSPNAPKTDSAPASMPRFSPPPPGSAVARPMSTPPSAPPQRPSSPPPASQEMPPMSRPAPSSRSDIAAASRPSAALPTRPASPQEITTWRAILDVIKKRRPALASVLAHAQIFDMTAERVTLGYDQTSFLFAQATDAAAKELLTTAVRAHFSAQTEVVLEIATGRTGTTVSDLDARERKAKHEAAKREVAEHPLVVAAIRTLGAELIDVKLVETVEAN